MSKHLLRTFLLLVTAALWATGPGVASAATKEKAVYTTDFTDWESVKAGAEAQTVSKTTKDGTPLTFTFFQAQVNPTGENTGKFTNTDVVSKGWMMTEKQSGPYMTISTFPSITKVSFVQAATGGKRGLTLYVKGDGDADWVPLHNQAIGKAQGEKLEYAVNRTNCQLKFGSFAEAQNGYLLSLEVYANVTVVGAEYALTTVATEGGKAEKYPNADTYTEGDEVRLTATPSFGYHFTSWTDKDGNIVSQEPEFMYTVTSENTLTANFQAVATYALTLGVDGGANGYMVSASPAPTMVDGKQMYEAGTRVTLTAISNPVVAFTNWSDGQTAASIDITMDADKAYTASYGSVLDCIAGWDFQRAGGSGRQADFFAADNDAVQLVMRNADGAQQGWLDKSQLSSGGYEGRAAAVNWRTDALGTWYWQTSVNAAAFTDVKIITAMAYNYNAYQKQLVEYSLDGETWKAAGSINIEGAKKWTDAEFPLPSECNNQAKVFIRWKSDTSSSVDGTSSKNDGIALGATYIVGTPKLVDDGTAPVVVSTVPQAGATTASANGKIVITFDEKIKLTADAAATLGTQTLTPTAAGKTVTCEYKGLDYSTEYTFTLAAGSVSDLTGNTLAEPVTITFTTRTKPTVAKKLYDFVVGRDGTVTEALAAANKTAGTERYRIFLPDGKYVFDTNGTKTGGDGKQYPNPISVLTASNVSFIGQSMEGVVITNITPDATWDNGYGQACPLEGIGGGDVLQISKAQNTYFQNLTIKTSMGDAHGRDIALNDKGSRTIFKDACLWGYQDTYVSNNQNGKYYFEGGVLRGRTDYLCGKGDVYYNGVTLQQCGAGGYIAVPSQPKQYGYIFEGCYIKKETADVTFTLGRPWGDGTPIAIFMNTTMDCAPLGDGWSEMSGGWPKRFAEYNSTLTTGTVLDLTGRKTTFGGHENCNSPVLTADEAAALTLAAVCGQDDDWDPTAVTEQASAPTRLTVNKDTKALTWDDSQYVLGWVVFKDGKYVANVTEPTYTVDDATATWTVRAANEAGGLGEAATAEVTTAIQTIETSADKNVCAPSYNIAGQRVNASAKGVVIRAGRKVVVK